MASKRILLMYISQVSGHRSAAMAIEKAIKLISPETEVLGINAFNYTNPISEKIINRIYMSVVSNAPKIWDYLYDNPAVVKRLSRIKKIVHKFNSPKLRKLFDEFQPDAIACTQAFPCGMVADYKKYHDCKIPLVAVLTDYVPHSYWLYDTVDYYVSPSEEVNERLVQKGILRERIRTLGIPFDLKFNEPVDKKSVLANLGLEEGIPTLLIMGGGHGLGPIKTIIGSLDKSKIELQEIIVTGANTGLYNELRKNEKKYKQKTIILGFAGNVHELMSISDITITKPGGITTAEALAKNMAMIIIKPIPGQEASNTDYLMKKNAALKVDDLDNIHLVVDDLLRDPARLQALRSAAAAISKPNSSVDIANLLLSLGDG